MFWVVTHISGQHVDPIFKDQGVHEEFFLDVLTNYQPVLCNIPKGQRPELQCSRNLKSDRVLKM
jgi:hypothetical protein